MTLHSRIFASLTATALVSVAATSANAASLYLTDVTPTANMTVAFPGVGPTQTPFVGAIQWSFDASAPANAGLAAIVPGNTLTTFCIEGTQDVTVHTTSTFQSILTDLATAPQDNVGSLYAMGANAATLNKFWDAYYGLSMTDAASAAAFQIGLWEIVYDNGTDLAAGNFQATAVVGDTTSGNARVQAQSWLNGLAAATPTTHYSLYVLSDPRLQDQLFGVQLSGGDVPPPAVPLPDALPIGMTMLAGLGVARRLRRR